MSTFPVSDTLSPKTIILEYRGAPQAVAGTLNMGRLAISKNPSNRML
jgi:hypothetical protein